MSDHHTCPVCGYAGLDEPHVDQHGYGSFEICSSCGSQFGYDDATRSHAELRRAWMAEGGRWWSEVNPAPAGWSADAQLKAAGFDRDAAPEPGRDG